jgi:hypothetical protein
MNRRDGKGNEWCEAKQARSHPGREKGKAMTESEKGNGPLSRDVIHRKRKKKEGKRPRGSRACP